MSREVVRKDGRQALQMRGRELKLSELSQFDGSCAYAQGLSSVLVALHGPTLAKQEVYDQCILHVRILHASAVPNAGGSERLVQQERLREQATVQDAHTLQLCLEEMVTAVFMKENFPRCVLGIDVLILHDDGSLLAVCANAVMCALLDAGLPCRTTAAAVCLCAMRHITTQEGKEEEEDESSEKKKRKGSNAEGGKKKMSSGNNNTTTTTTTTRTYFLLDPTLAEEQNEALQHAGAGAATASNASAEASNALQLDSIISNNNNNNKGRNENSNGNSVLGDEAIATGTFILANPASGGGLLGSCVQACASPSTLPPSLPSQPLSSTQALQNPTPPPAHDDKEDSVSSNALSVEELGEMIQLATRTAPLLFDFFRQCNVPLEEPAAKE